MTHNKSGPIVFQGYTASAGDGGKSTIDGGTYYAVVYSDDGDAIFNPAKDLPLKDASGKAIMRVFRATSSANIEVKG